MVADRYLVQRVLGNSETNLGLFGWLRYFGRSAAVFDERPKSSMEKVNSKFSSPTTFQLNFEKRRKQRNLKKKKLAKLGRCVSWVHFAKIPL